jgi:hypothetical protein
VHFEIVGAIREVRVITAGPGIRSMTRSRAAPLKVRTSPRKAARFALCVSNREYPASPEVWKIYRVVPDSEAARHGQLRVIDESGEGYLFPAEYFRLVELPSPLSRLYPAKAS